VVKKRDLTLHAEPGTYAVYGSPIAVTMTSFLLLDWFEIAIRHEQATRSARASGDAGRERQEAMIVAAASAHALEGLRRELRSGLDRHAVNAAVAAEPAPSGRDATARQVNATLALALDVDPSTWRVELADLFDTLRNPAVHPRAEAAPPVPHPDPARDVHVSRESALYTLERAKGAVTLLAEVMARLLSNRGASPAAEAVAASIAPRVEQLLAELSNPAGDMNPRRGRRVDAVCASCGYSSVRGPERQHMA
jgi:hypothetical protein